MPAHIEKRYKGSWTVVIDRGRGPDGKRQRVVKSVKGTKRDAEKEMARLIHEIETGSYVEPSRQTLSEYLDHWWTNVWANSTEVNTAENYRIILETHLKPGLGKIKLQDLKPLHIQDYCTTALKEGRKDGKGGLSNRSVQYHYSVLRRALEQAVDWELIPRNPAARVKAPKPAKRKVVTMTLEEARKLFGYLRDKSIFPLVYTAVYTGLRRGELLALRWQDIDLVGGVINVQQTLVRVSGKGYFFSDCKTDSSRRAVPVPPNLAILFEDMKVAIRPSPGDLLFQRSDGQPLDPSTLSHQFSDMAGEAGFPGLRFHDLRHLHASILFALNVHPKVVQERLGHSNIGTTIDTYSHALPTMQVAAIQAMQDALEPGTGPPAGPVH